MSLSKTNKKSHAARQPHPLELPSGEVSPHSVGRPHVSPRKAADADADAVAPRKKGKSKEKDADKSRSVATQGTDEPKYSVHRKKKDGKAGEKTTPQSTDAVPHVKRSKNPNRHSAPTILLADIARQREAEVPTPAPASPRQLSEAEEQPVRPARLSSPRGPVSRSLLPSVSTPARQGESRSPLAHGDSGNSVTPAGDNSSRTERNSPPGLPGRSATLPSMLIPPKESHVEGLQAYNDRMNAMLGRTDKRIASGMQRMDSSVFFQSLLSEAPTELNASPEAQTITSTAQAYQGEQRVVSPRGSELSSVYWDSRKAITEADSEMEDSDTDDSIRNGSVAPARPDEGSFISSTDTKPLLAREHLERVLNKHSGALQQLGIESVLKDCAGRINGSLPTSSSQELFQAWMAAASQTKGDLVVFAKIVSLAKEIARYPDFLEATLDPEIKYLIFTLGQPCASRLAKYYASQAQKFTL